MKIVKNIVLAAMAMAGLAACKKDFLERRPETSISDASFWRSANDLRLFTNQFYNNILPAYTGYFTAGIYGLDADQGSDNMVQRAYNTALNSEVTVPTNNNVSWSGLREVNYFIKNYNRVTEPFDSYKRYVGEAYFFRAMLYANIVKQIGDAPWINEPLTPADIEILQSPRISRAIVTDSIMADLDKAAAYLPAKSNDGRIYREVALALQARIALYEGTWEKYHAGDAYGVAGSTGTKFLQKSLEASSAIMATNQFDLDNQTGAAMNYFKLFNQADYNSSKEVMFWRRYDVAANITNYWASYAKLGNGRGVTKSLVDSYLCTDGKPIAASTLYKGDNTLVDVVTNRDARLNQTIAVNDGKHVVTEAQPGLADTYFTAPTLLQAAEDNNVTGYQLYKGLDTKYANQLSGKGVQGLIYFRYAEVLLNYAEAKAELGTLAQTDVDKTINKLRSRVGMPTLVLASITTDPNWQFPELGPIINEVRRERRVELAAEGFRHDDLFRWAAAGKLIKGWKPRGAKKAQFYANATTEYKKALDALPVDDSGYIMPYKNVSVLASGYQFNTGRDYLSPISTSQINLAGYKQNPGYQ